MVGEWCFEEFKFGGKVVVVCVCVLFKFGLVKKVVNMLEVFVMLLLL